MCTKSYFCTDSCNKSITLSRFSFCWINLHLLLAGSMFLCSLSCFQSFTLWQKFIQKTVSAHLFGIMQQKPLYFSTNLIHSQLRRCYFIHFANYSNFIMTFLTITKPKPKMMFISTRAKQKKKKPVTVSQRQWERYRERKKERKMMFPFSSLARF